LDWLADNHELLDAKEEETLLGLIESVADFIRPDPSNVSSRHGRGAAGRFRRRITIYDVP
jgi:hypothetical protein